MSGVSQALDDFANHFRQPPAPGVEIIDTPRYRITLQPDYPIPGPNGVSWIRCKSEEADEVIEEVHATVNPRHLPLMWVLDPGTEPEDFGDYLAVRRMPAEVEVAIMALPIETVLESPPIEGLEMRDALADLETFQASDAVNAEAFGDAERGRDEEEVAAQERRRQNQLAAGNRRMLLAVVDGEPAGSAGLTLYPPLGAIITGGAVREKFRGRGVYRAMVAARLQMARDAGVAGLAVWGGPMSAPILTGLGFEKVGWRRFYLDTTTG